MCPRPSPTRPCAPCAKSHPTHDINPPHHAAHTRTHPSLGLIFLLHLVERCGSPTAAARTAHNPSPAAASATSALPSRPLTQSSGAPTIARGPRAAPIRDVGGAHAGSSLPTVAEHWHAAQGASVAPPIAAANAAAPGPRSARAPCNNVTYPTHTFPPPWPIRHQLARGAPALQTAQPPTPSRRGASTHSPRHAHTRTNGHTLHVESSSDPPAHALLSPPGRRTRQNGSVASATPAVVVWT